MLCSVLGYTQIYYSNGGYCSFSNHFLSLHSYVGIAVLAIYWCQGGLAALVLSNKALLKPGTTARALFLRAHQAVGVGVSCAAAPARNRGSSGPLPFPAPRARLPFCPAARLMRAATLEPPESQSQSSP